MAVFLIIAALIGLVATLVFGTSLYFRVSLSGTGARAFLQLRLLFDLIKLPIRTHGRKRRKKSEDKKRYSAHKLLDIPKLKLLRVTSRVGVMDAAETVLLAGFLECLVKAVFAPYMAKSSDVRLFIRPIFNQSIFWFDLEGIIVLDVSQIMHIFKRGRK